MSSLPLERTWSLKEIDESLGLVKGNAFIAFKRVRGKLQEERDFLYYSGFTQAQQVAELKRSGRIYASTVNAVLLKESAYQAVLSYLSAR